MSTASAAKLFVQPASTPVEGELPIETLADLHRRLGGIPLERIRCHPAPGTATEADVLHRPNGEKRLFELVHGVLVEKPMGYYESVVAAVLIQLLRDFLDEHGLGVVSDPDGTVRLMPGLVRIPDVAYVSWDRFRNRRLPAEPIPDLAPELAVEVGTDGEQTDRIAFIRADHIPVALSPEPSVRTLLSSAIRRLEAVGVDTPRLDAELLLAHALRTTRTALFAYPERRLTSDEATLFEVALRRREAREPLPYILGEWEFLGLPFKVTPAVLIPRPETEVLVETVAARLATKHGREFPFRLLDVGTGSGCVAIGLGRLLPRATVVAVEPSAAAVAVARENAATLGVGDRLAWVAGAFPEAMAERAGEFDAVVSNPPYIPEGEIGALQPEVRDWEPRLALTPGTDGLALIRALVEHAPRLLRPSGLLAIEVAQGQAERVMEMLRESMLYAGIERIADLNHIDRVCMAWSQTAPSADSHVAEISV